MIFLHFPQVCYHKKLRFPLFLPLFTVFENNDFSGKKLVPFSTHEGSGLSGFDKKLASACPDAEVLDGLAVRGNDAQNRQDSVRETVQDWLSGLGY